MYDYTIFPDNSPKEFKKVCKMIQSVFPNATVHELLVDVDGSTIQTFTQDGKDIDVYDDYDVGAVYVKSEVDLGNIFL
ncbi:MAG: hypothetical protein E7267_03045 [Lachnospiraceae bacterium]|nr:hypothetical protein [Lachnospiraceae bacterium]